MARFDELDEEQQQQWHSRVARKRLDLSASVEEALIDGPAQEDQWVDELDDSAIVPASKATALIPPRLSLQSKQMPVVPPNTSGTAKSPPNPSDDTKQTTSATENAGVLARFAQRISSSLASLGGALQTNAPAITEGKQNSSKIEGETPVRPVVQTIPKESTMQALSTKAPVSHSAVASQPAQSKQRLAFRTTKVRLQVVPKLEVAEKLVEKTMPLYETITNPNMPAAERLEIHAGTIAHEVRESLSGTGVFESEQSDVAVANTNITPSSVVVVVLTGDPGPVVVQYVSLQHRVGFTIHLSAPTKNATTFNYRIL